MTPAQLGHLNRMEISMNGGKDGGAYNNNSNTEHIEVDSAHFGAVIDSLKNKGRAQEGG